MGMFDLLTIDEEWFKCANGHDARDNDDVQTKNLQNWPNLERFTVRAGRLLEIPNFTGEVWVSADCNKCEPMFRADDKDRRWKRYPTIEYQLVFVDGALVSHKPSHDHGTVPGITMRNDAGEIVPWKPYEPTQADYVRGALLLQHAMKPFPIERLIKRKTGPSGPHR